MAKSLLLAGAFGVRIGGREEYDLEFLFQAEITNSDPVSQAENVKEGAVG